MKLSELLAALPDASIQGDIDVTIQRIISDSRRAQAGDVFVAYPGVSVDGRTFIAEAIARGASAIIIENEEIKGDKGRLGEIKEITVPSSSLISPNFPLVVVQNGRAALAQLSAALHGFPARRMTMIGVTGTDGKTTTATLIRSILQTAGHPTGLISTVAAYIGERELDTGFHTTTPDAPDVQAYLAQMVAADTRYAIVEATSFGLAQQRLVACDFDVAVLTNITHEHLDGHHNSFEEYRAAKRILFEDVAHSPRKGNAPKVSVLNADDASYADFAAVPAEVHLAYGLTRPADITAEHIQHTPQGLSFVVRCAKPHRFYNPGRSGVLIESPLIGRYNVSNILAAMCVALSQKVPTEAIPEGVRRVSSVSGRMERMDCGQSFTVIVDFAHTPQALENALQTARELTHGRVTVVFGCAGLRDSFKRPMMGEIAGRLADHVIITAEDPRTESLDAIMQRIAEGCERVGGNYTKIGDRYDAIAFALQHARAGDLVIITGKGHERSMCFGTTEYPWSDQEVVREILKRET
jgi:UDP-N-acetylmuramoyl-L-alanyl-D-glutamate--2,6-diaminopimelate ligase